MEVFQVDGDVLALVLLFSSLAFLTGSLFTARLLDRRSARAAARRVSDPGPEDSREQMRQQRIRALVTTAFRDLVEKDDFTVFLFGPSTAKPPSHVDDLESLAAKKRAELFSLLNESEYFTLYGEELGSLGSEPIDRLNPLLKEHMVIGKINLIIVLAVGSGPLVELGYFSADPAVCKKMVIAVHAEDKEGFLAKGPVRQAQGLGAKVVEFTTEELRRCDLASKLLDRAGSAYEGYLLHRLAARGGIGLMQ